MEEAPTEDRPDTEREDDPAAETRRPADNGLTFWKAHMTGMKPADLPFDLLRSDPQRYLELTHEIVRQNPTDRMAYFVRQQAFSELGHHELALADVDTAIALSESNILLHNLRGLVLRDLNRHQEAVEEFSRGRELDPESWGRIFAPLFRAHSHALLGNLDEALADCAALPEDHWTPGLFGAPPGTKQEVTEQIRRLAGEARRR
jgi:tetratricopeptide (TPR) repeat protein